MQKRKLSRYLLCGMMLSFCNGICVAPSSGGAAPSINGPGGIAPATQPPSVQQPGSAPPQQPQSTPKQPGPTQAEQSRKQLQTDCSHLSTQEQAFAEKLSVMHRTMYCRHFSVEQRAQAMSLVDLAQTKGQTAVTPDAAVEAVLQSARTAPIPSTPPAKK